MIHGLWGRKIGMTQVFSSENKVVPVTAIEIVNWYVTQIKTKDVDTYSAVQIGCIKKKYAEQPFSNDWLSNPKKYFSILKEVRLDKDATELSVGQKTPDLENVFEHGQKVDVVGTTKGCGFAGGMRRHGFSGGKASHGSKLGRAPGSLSFMRRQGRVIKGKKMPGHMGVDRRVMTNLEVIKISPEMVLVKGSVPGKAGTFVFVKKSR